AFAIRTARPPQKALKTFRVAEYRTTIWLFFLASFHAYIVFGIVFGLARLCRIIFCAGLLLLATLLATVRLFRLYCSDAAKTEQHDENRADGSHDDPPLDVATTRV